jgi:hypothetical protein
MSTSTLSKLPTPDEIHAELVATLQRAATLRKLLRISQRLDERRDRADEQAAVTGDKETANAR